MPTPISQIPAEKIFDVRNIPCSVKHRQILDRWLALSVGDFFVLKNDHDPVPLRYQFQAEFSDAFTWEHLEKGPEVYQVKISKLQDVARKNIPMPSGCQH